MFNLTEVEISYLYKLTEIHFTYLIKMNYDVKYEDILKLNHIKMVDILTEYNTINQRLVATKDLLLDYIEKYK